MNTFRYLPNIISIWKVHICNTRMEPRMESYFGYLITNRLGAGWRGPSVHAAILDANTKHSDVVMRRLIRLMFMVESDDIDIPNKNSHLITLVVL